MESIFTYDANPPKVSSPWSTSGRGSSPPPADNDRPAALPHLQAPPTPVSSPVHLSETGVTRLEAEPQEGPTEYKLHLLLRPRRRFSSFPASTQVSGSQPSTSHQLKAGPRPTDPAANSLVQPPSAQSRQIRLQQLTTQLLWRLQQSSPFHSCSTAGLVLPTLPQATPTLGLPSKPARLPPGLEESQGALYEIGVSDDGTLVGLAKDELEESLTNLKAMAASLGCVVKVLREVVVGQCEQRESDHLTAGDGSVANAVDVLWVAEALVRPDLGQSFEAPRTASFVGVDSTLPSQSGPILGTHPPWPESPPTKAEQLRISIVGATNSGKSSLLGTLTTSVLDNGRGKSRLNLLKHRHEIASGITSSVAQELVGYRTRAPLSTPEMSHPASADVVNYASENVSSWNDIHASAARLMFMSDSPGLARYSKSTIRTLFSWKPHWVILCVAADGEVGDTVVTPTVSTRSSSPASRPSDRHDPVGNAVPFLLHLDLCLKLDLSIIVVVTKMDIATRNRLRHTLATLLSVLKVAARKPALISASDSPRLAQDDQRPDLQYIRPGEQAEVDSVMKTVQEMGTKVVPIVFTSVMTGQGIGTLHGLLRSIPVLDDITLPSPSSAMLVREQREMRSKIFQIDEVFAMLPSKVYSASTEVGDTDQGVVLCGYVSSGVVRLGGILMLGPFLLDEGGKNAPAGRPMDRHLSFPNLATCTAPVVHNYARSTPTSGVPAQDRAGRAKMKIIWQSVRVVSLRNLRLPVRRLEAGQVGTVGIEPVRHLSRAGCDLRHARKGMVLTLFEDEELVASRSFTATFPACDFQTPDSPPLILGGHATVYINSIRATATVASVALNNHDEKVGSPAAQGCDIFGFESSEKDGERDQGIQIKFRFLRTVEWVSVEDKVFVVPNTATSSTSTSGSIPPPGVNGFVGTICDLHV